MEGVDAVTGGGESDKVGGKDLRRAGDVDEGGRGDAGEQLADLRAGSGAGRVEDDEVGTVALDHRGAEEVERGGLDGAEIDEAGCRECAGGGFGDLDCGDAVEVWGERAGKEADAGVEVPR